MPLDLYYASFCSHCRSVMLTAKALELELQLKKVNLMIKDHLKDEFVALNPQHRVPTLVDGDFVLWESYAICNYLIAKYSTEGNLYPSDPKIRAMVDRLLYFDIGVLYQRFSEYIYPVIEEGLPPNEEKLSCLNEALVWLDKLLAGHEWVVGDSITVADNVIVATVSTIEAVGIDLTKHTNVTTWLQRCKSNIPGYTEINEPGAKEVGKMFKEKLASRETQPEIV